MFLNNIIKLHKLVHDLTLLTKTIDKEEKRFNNKTKDTRSKDAAIISISMGHILNIML